MQRRYISILSQKGGHTWLSNRHDFETEAEDQFVQPISFLTEREKKEHGSATWLFEKNSRGIKDGDK